MEPAQCLARIQANTLQHLFTPYRKGIGQTKAIEVKERK
jgi:hypothetical protein